MKYVILGLVFLVAPYLLLSNFVMPTLESLQDVYSNADVISQQTVQEGSSVEQSQAALEAQKNKLCRPLERYHDGCEQ